jgi:hypothetical protein
MPENPQLNLSDIPQQKFQRGHYREPEIPIRITQQRKFSNAADYEAFSVVRLHNAMLPSLGGRNAWVTIKSMQGACVYRMIRGSGGLENFPQDAIEFDYETGMALGITKAKQNAAGFYPCALEVRPASRLEILAAHWNHPDHAYRFPLQLSLVSFFLGIVGLILGLLSFL